MVFRFSWLVWILRLFVGCCLGCLCSIAYVVMTACVLVYYLLGLRVGCDV